MRRKLMTVVAAACGATIVLAPSRAAPQSVTDDATRIAHLLERARDAMGDADGLRAGGGLTLAAAGTLDKGAEHQGRSPGSQDPGPFHEQLAVAPSGRLAYAYREDRYDGTFEALRQVYTENDERLIVLPESRQVIRLRSPEHPEARRRLARRIPLLLVDEVLARSADVRWLGRVAGEERIELPLSSGRTLTLGFEPESAVLVRAEYRMDMPSFGDVTVAWSFSEYTPLQGLGLFPRRYTCTIQDRIYVDMRVSEVAMEDRPGLLMPPDDYSMSDPIDDQSGSGAAHQAAVGEIVPGVRRVTRLRQGFHPMFVEFADFIVAIDAPAGYPLVTELPAGDVAPGPSSSWLSERYISLIEQAVPGKPIRYVVLTHHHGDHMGGVRAFLAEGATVLAPPATAALVERLARAPHTIAPDRLSTAPQTPSIEVVRGERTITDGTRTLTLIDVGDNPHGVEMLVAHLPAERLMFVSDLLDPTAVERYPKPGHAALDRFFGAWLADSGLSPERIYTMHGSGLVTAEHLARLRTDS